MSHRKRNYGIGVLFLAAAIAGLQLSGQTPQRSQPAAQAQQGQSRPAARPPQRRSFLISRDVPDAAAVERGKTLFVAKCGFCHGSGATGGETGPDLVRSALALDDEGGDHIGPVIRKGFPDKGMPPFPLTDDQIKDIAAFIRNRQQAAINRGQYEIQNIVTGDARKGEAFFNGAGKCNTCHSPTGDLKGIAGKYEPVMLQSRFLFPAPRRRGGGAPPPPSTVTVTPASGSPVTGVLAYIDDFDVALRDSTGAYRSFTRDKNLKVEVKDPLAGHLELLKQYTDDDMHNILAYLVTLK